MTFIYPDFSEAVLPPSSYFEFCLSSIPQGQLEIVPFKKDGELEKHPSTTAQQCLRTFLSKGGTLQNLSPSASQNEKAIHLFKGDAIYPVCSGGLCRSQTLWAILRPFSHQITLFSPHAARYGWDPYNGQINRARNAAHESPSIPDEFHLYFGIEKAQRFGFEQEPFWQRIEKSPTKEGLDQISQYYDEHYFGSHSSWQGNKGERRVYIAFANNTHTILYRLNQVNDSLEGVVVVAIDLEDLVTYPPESLNTTSRSQAAYAYFAQLLLNMFDISDLINPPNNK